MRLATLRVALRNATWHCLGRCPLCGRRAVFLQLVVDGSFREGLTCCWCRSASRKRHVALVVRELLGRDSGTAGDAVRSRGARVLSTQGGDALATSLLDVPTFETSELVPGMPLGASLGPRATCQDLERLTFPDQSFDLVITEDVLEHVRDPERALEEIRRVLSPGGHHVFTVPYHLDRPTIVRVDTSGDDDVHLLPPEYHGDPIRGQILAYRTFGTDLLGVLDRLGFETRLRVSGRREARAGVYDSVVLVSRRVR